MENAWPAEGFGEGLLRGNAVEQGENLGVRAHQRREEGNDPGEARGFDGDEHEVGRRAGPVEGRVVQFEAPAVEGRRIRLVAGDAAGIGDDAEARGIARGDLGGVEDADGAEADDGDVVDGRGVHGRRVTRTRTAPLPALAGWRVKALSTAGSRQVVPC